MVGKADTSTTIDWTRAVLLSMVAVGSGLGGVRGFGVWLLDRGGGLCVHKTVVGESEVEEMTEPATVVQSVESWAALELVVVFGRSRRTIQVCVVSGKSTEVTPASACLFRHTVEKHSKEVPSDFHNTDQRQKTIT